MTAQTDTLPTNPNDSYIPTAKSNKRVIFAILSIGLLLILGLGIYYTLNSSSTDSKSSKTSGNVATTTSNKVTPDWVEFKDISFEYSAKMPSGWKFTQGKRPNKFAGEGGYQSGIGNNTFSILITTQEQYESDSWLFIDWVENWTEHISYENSQVDGLAAIYTRDVSTGEGGSRPGHVDIATFFKKGPYLYSVRAGYMGEKESEILPTYKEFLKTFKFDQSKFTNFSQRFEVVSLSYTSPTKLYVVSEELLGDNNKITITDSSGKIITSDLVTKENSQTLGYGTRIACQCGESFAGWIDDSSFILKVLNGYGSTYIFSVNAATAKIDGNSFYEMGT